MIFDNFRPLVLSLEYPSPPPHPQKKIFSSNYLAIASHFTYLPTYLPLPFYFVNQIFFFLFPIFDFFAKDCKNRKLLFFFWTFWVFWAFWAFLSRNKIKYKMGFWRDFDAGFFNFRFYFFFSFLFSLKRNEMRKTNNRIREGIRKNKVKKGVVKTTRHQSNFSQDEQLEN